MVMAGPGVLQADSVQTERATLSASKQPVFVVRPLAGYEIRSANLLLRLAGSLTWATGNWYAPKNYGATDGEGPPQRSGVLTYGLHLGVGVGL